MTRAGSPGIMRTPVNTMTVISASVTAEMNARRTRNSITALLPARSLDADQPVGDGRVAFEVLRERDDVVREVEVDGAPARQEQVVGLTVERRPLADVAHLAGLAEERVDLLVARERLVEAAAARMELVDVVIGVHAAAPADEEGLVLAVLVVLERGGELLGSQRDVEPGLARHALNDLADAPLLRVVDDHHLEAVAAGGPGLGQELLGSGHVAAGALTALVEERAVRRDRGAAGRVQAVPRHLIEGLAVDRELERLPNAWVVCEWRAEVPRRLRLADLVVEVDGDAVVAEARHVRDLEPPFLLEARRVGRRHQVHEVDVARAEVRQPDVVVGDDAKDDAIELRTGGGEVR